MKLDRVAFGLGIVAVVASALVYFGRPTIVRPLGPVHADMVLAERDGACKVVAKTDPVVAHRGAIVVWVITNTCDTDQTVSFRDFADGDPFGPGPREIMIPAQKTRVLSMPVRAAAAVMTYHYAPYLNGVRQSDPEIIIEY